MSFVTVQEQSPRQAGFYTPHFEVRIEGQAVAEPILRDVTQLVYHDDVDALDGFELTVNNWDPVENNFKYVGAETCATLGRNDAVGQRHKLFEPCGKEVTVKMGYLDELRVMMLGTFTTMEPNFPSGGAPTLTVRGLNVLHQLRRKRHTKTWERKTDSEIAREISRRFPLPITTAPGIEGREPRLDFVSQTNQTDLDFLLARARERGYVLFIQEANPGPPARQRSLYFGPSDTSDISGLHSTPYRLAWGTSLIDFKPTLTTANQYRSVTVNGWDRRRRRAISETVTLDDRELNRNQDLYRLLNACDPQEELVVERVVFTTRDARALAVSILQDRQKEMVKASGTTIGLPDLRAGQRVYIDNVGERFSGTYFIKKTTHTIGESGYTTRFEARRESERRPC